MRKVQKEILSDATEKSFFDLFFKAKSVTLIIGYFGQLVSGLTEFHFVFSAADGVYKPFFVWSNLLPITLGLLAVYIFEVLGVRVYLVRIVRQIANREFVNRESWILFGFNLLFVFALCGSNLWFSLLGQTASFHNMTNIRVTDKTFGIDSLKNIEIAAVTTNYDKKENTIRNDYNRNKQEMTLHYDGIINEYRTNRWTVSDDKSKYDSYTTKIDNTLAEKDEALKLLDSKLDVALINLMTNKTKAIERIETTFDRRISDIENNTNSRADLWSMVQQYTKPILIVFILLSWLSIIYTEVFYKGSGQFIKVKEVNYRPLLLWVLIVGLYDKFYHWFYNNVVGWVGLDKFRYGQIRINEVEYKAEEALNRNKDESSRPPYIAAKVRQIGFVRYRDTKTTPQIRNFAVSSANLTTTIPNDYELHTNGSRNNNDDRNNGDRRELQNNERICKNCNSIFTFKHWNKRYCSDDCRIEHWENRTGRKLNKGRKS